MNNSDAYYRLVMLITGDEAFSLKLANELDASDREPETFFQQHHEQYFSNRGIDKAGHKEQTLCYLLDVLQENNYGAELDWKGEIADLNYVISRMTKGKVEDLLEEVDEDDEPMNELLDNADELLEEHGLRILHFPLDSDSHPISLVPADRLDEAEQLVEELFPA